MILEWLNYNNKLSTTRQQRWILNKWYYYLLLLLLWLSLYLYLGV